MQTYRDKGDGPGGDGLPREPRAEQNRRPERQHADKQKFQHRPRAEQAKQHEHGPRSEDSSWNAPFQPLNKDCTGSSGDASAV